jgi:hypothetical protein
VQAEQKAKGDRPSDCTGTLHVGNILKLRNENVSAAKELQNVHYLAEIRIFSFFYQFDRGPGYLPVIYLILPVTLNP